MILNQIMWSHNYTFKQLCRTLVITAWKVTCRIAITKSTDQIQARNKRQPLFSCTFAAAVVNRSRRTSVAIAASRLGNVIGGSQAGRISRVAAPRSPKLADPISFKGQNETIPFCLISRVQMLVRIFTKYYNHPAPINKVMVD